MASFPFYLLLHIVFVDGGTVLNSLTTSEPPKCNKPGSLDNGRVLTWGGDLLIEYLCDPGYFAIGLTFGACIPETGRWTVEPPKCVAPGCPFPSVQRNMKVRLTERNTVAIFSCGRRHYLIGKNTQAYCNGTHWSKPFPICVASSARSVNQDPKNQNLPGTQVTEGEFLNATALDFDANIRQSDRSCFRYRYLAPPEIPNAEVTPRYIHDDIKREYVLIANYTCVFGYVLEHSLARYLYCRLYRWTAAVKPKCVKLVDTSLTVAGYALQKTTCEKPRPSPLCSQICLSGASGNYACDCYRGFRLGNDGRKCFDRNECLESNGGCDQRCYNTYGSRICACNEGYQSFGPICIDIDECGDPDLNDCPDDCVNVPGSYQCNCTKPGFRTGDDGSPCEDEDECADNNGRCEDVCENSAGSYVCHCNKQGYHLSRDLHNCTDIDECKKYGRKICRNGECVNTPGSFSCSCDEGFMTGKSKTYCQDIDECKEDNGGCEHVCKNTVGSYRCQCPLGYRLVNGKNCTDVNECDESNGGCDDLCINALASYQCWCNQTGYLLAEDGRKCTGKQLNKCDESNGGCDDLCINALASYQCWCNQTGYLLAEDGRKCTVCENDQYIVDDKKLCVDCPNNSRTGQPLATSLKDCVCLPGFHGSPEEEIPCEDIDECQDMHCEYGCDNTPGSAQCTCPDGYYLMLQTQKCVDVNECMEENGGCNDTCDNLPGSFRCGCSDPGIQLAADNRTCEDINECMVFNNNCSQTCTNVWGGAVCGCLPGYNMTEDLSTCLDINECADLALSGCEDLCINTQGSYHCDCSGDGLKLSWDRKSCSDINECMEGHNECEDLCINTRGSYRCACNESSGLTVGSDGRSCQDLDECESEHTNQCDQICINLDKGYSCECREGFLKKGEYECVGCPVGFYKDLDNDTCVECPEFSTTNGTGGVTIGSCHCIEGYKGDLTNNETCTDVNECKEGEEEDGGCQQLCANNVGSYYCSCRKGFNLHRNGRNCTDIDECAEGYWLCTELCINLEGSFTCGCRDGFTLHWDGRYCTDVNECYLGTHKCQGQCDNTWGSYTCSCPERGTRLDSDGISCVSIGNLPRCPNDVNILVNDGVEYSHVSLPSVVYSGQFRIVPDWVISGTQFPLGVTEIDIMIMARGGEEVGCSFNVTVASRCGLGTFKDGDACSICPPGTYQNEVGQLACKDCRPGMFQNEEGMTRCKYCPPGTFQNETRQAACNLCAKGTSSDESGEAFCERCPPGSYQNQIGQTKCKLCEIDTFNNRYGKENCMPCGERKYQDERGLTYCKRCPPFGYLHIYNLGNNHVLLRKCKNETQTI